MAIRERETGRFSSDKEKVKLSPCSAHPAWCRFQLCVAMSISWQVSIQLSSCQSSFFHMHISLHLYTSLWGPVLTNTVIKVHSTPMHVNSHNSFPMGSSHWCIVFLLNLPAVKYKPNASLHPLFSPSSPALSPCWPCVFHTSDAFSYPALWTQIFSLGLCCQGELSPSSVSFFLPEKARWTHPAGLGSLKALKYKFLWVHDVASTHYFQRLKNGSHNVKVQQF